MAPTLAVDLEADEATFSGDRPMFVLSGAVPLPAVPPPVGEGLGEDWGCPDSGRFPEKGEPLGAGGDVSGEEAGFAASGGLASGSGAAAGAPLGTGGEGSGSGAGIVGEGVGP